MRKLIVSEWLSLDGVFDADTMESWFNPYDSKARQEHIRSEALACEAMLLGRTTYQMFAAYWPKMKKNEMGVADKLNDEAKIVVSKSLERAEWNNSTVVRGIEDVARLKLQTGGDIQVPGSATLVVSLLKANLVDEIRLLVHPVIAGGGKRFFRDGTSTTRFELVDSRPLDRGVMALRYRKA